MPSANRCIEIKSTIEGSGYLLTDRLILTAAHVLGDHSDAIVRIEHEIEPNQPPSAHDRTARTIWPIGGARDPHDDYALLALAEPFVDVTAMRPVV